jgi:hypothetical protein
VPDEGRVRHNSYLIELPAERPSYPALPWTCANVAMINVYFEVRKDPLLDRLPPEFCRTSPAYCRLTIIDNPDSPAGPFRDAILALGCRLNMMPAAYVAASITDSSKALGAGIFERGFPNELGKIEFEHDLNHARTLVSDSRGPLLEVMMPSLQAIEPSRLAYDHTDSLRTVEGGKVELTVVSPDVKIERAAICKNARIEYPVERPDSPWQALNCRNVVSAQLVRGPRTFAPGHKPR